jgi:aspartate-semialdehyde dehydrogenase
LKQAAAKEQIETVLTKQAGMIYESTGYQTPAEIVGQQEIFAARLRIDRTNPAWLQLWVTGDNLRKGAASNAVQILQELFS